MVLELENKNLVRVINFLDKLELKGMKSIYRTKLSNLLLAKLQEIEIHQNTLRQQYPKESKEDIENLKEELETLLNEKVVIDNGDSQVMLQSVKNVVKEILLDEKTGFRDADAYALEKLFYAFDLGDEM